MTAIRAASTSLTLLTSTSSTSYTRPSILTRLRFGGGWANISIAVAPLSSRRAKRTAHLIARATLALTQLNVIDSPKISFSAKEIDLVEWKGDILVVAVTEKDLVKDDNLKFQNSILQKLDSQLGGLLSDVSSEEDFTGKAGQTTILRLPGLGSKRIGLIGLGMTASPPVAYHSLGEAVASVAKSALASNVAVAFASTEGIPVEVKPNAASAIASAKLFSSQISILNLQTPFVSDNLFGWNRNYTGNV